LDAVKKKIFPSRQSNPDYSVVQHADKSPYRLNDPASKSSGMCQHPHDAAWGLPPQPDFRLLASEQRPMVPCSMTCKCVQVYTASRDQCLVRQQLPVSSNTSERYSQSNGYKIGGVPMQPEPHTGCTPRLECRVSQKSTINLHF
jgi:hypothetical protein